MNETDNRDTKEMLSYYEDRIKALELKIKELEIENLNLRILEESMRVFSD